MEKRLMRSSNKMVSGVGAGVAKYLNIDPTIIRVVLVLLLIWNPPLVLVSYLVLAYFLPKEEEDTVAKAHPFDEEEIVVKDGS